MINQGKKKIMSKKNLRIDLESWTFHIPSINIQSELEEPLLKLYHEYRSPLSALTLTANAKIFTSKNHFKQWIASHKQEEFHNWKVFHLSQEITFFYNGNGCKLPSLYRRVNIPMLSLQFTAICSLLIFTFHT